MITLLGRSIENPSHDLRAGKNIFKQKTLSVEEESFGIQIFLFLRRHQ